MTDSTPYPNAFVAVVVGLTEPPSMADDRVVVAYRTLPRQEVQGDHPGSMLSFSSGSAIKRITAWREGPPLTVLCKSSDLLAGPSPSGKASNEKRIQLCSAGREPLTPNIGRFKTTYEE